VAAEYHTAVQHPSEIQLKVVMLWAGRGIATGVETQDEIVAPVRSGVGYAGGDEEGVG
jgi:hypothetical protein